MIGLYIVESVWVCMSSYGFCYDCKNEDFLSVLHYLLLHFCRSGYLGDEVGACPPIVLDYKKCQHV